ncbi:TetR/AcrR family transcriptional regulator [Streptomyces sp. NBC_01351]|uniref:TetR/AcrR family transcriptional regulator n=1 Tax=Streptomyces sp. NBC_01351 TaxID=2903833 RepID=UPI002E2F00C3|nr:TetR/AcrR family transcriptional regulator [Streptomyces sp. NBC_01351]
MTLSGENGQTAPRARSRRAFDRDKALAVALEEFWTYGYETTSIASLTKAMGINPPSLYAAFGDKRQLFGEAVELYQRTYGTVPASEEVPDARTAVRAVLMRVAADYTDPRHPPGCLIITAATNCGPGSQDVQTDLRTIREATKASLAALIRRDVETGALPGDVDAEGLATFYASVIQGMNQQAVDGASRETLEKVAEAAMRAWPEPGPA